MATLLDEVTADVVGAAVEFTGPVTVLLRGVHRGKAIAILEMRLPDDDWGEIYRFAETSFTVDAEGTYELRGVAVGVQAGENFSIKTLE